MADNMDLWHRAFTTAHSAVKPITGKQYKGNSPKPYWIVQRLTEELGPCGIGWGMVIVNERFERLTETDVLHVATVRLWYELDGKRGELEQMGQTKACYKTSKGDMMIDEDAPKKSVTDALVKCASYLGFAGDIFSGRWDDSKYVQERREEEAMPAPTFTMQEEAAMYQQIHEAETMRAAITIAEEWQAKHGTGQDESIRKELAAKKEAMRAAQQKASTESEATQ